MATIEKQYNHQIIKNSSIEKLINEKNVYDRIFDNKYTLDYGIILKKLKLIYYLSDCFKNKHVNIRSA